MSPGLPDVPHKIQMHAAPAAQAPVTLRLPVSGMTCASCVGRVERALRAVPGVRRADVHLGQEQALVEVDAKVGLAALIAAV